ncbi:hypothetical protein D3C78_911000 [compost metagenome]
MIRRAEQGFTLLELLLVLVVIGSVLGMVGLSTLQDESREARQQARSVVDLMFLGRQSAVLEGREYGLCILQGRIRLMRWQGVTWQPHGQGLFTDLDLQLQMDGRRLRLPEHCVEPQVLISSSDEVAAFTLQFERKGQRLASVVSDGLDDLHSDG